MDEMIKQPSALQQTLGHIESHILSLVEKPNDKVDYVMEIIKDEFINWRKANNKIWRTRLKKAIAGARKKDVVKAKKGEILVD